MQLSNNINQQTFKSHKITPKEVNQLKKAIQNKQVFLYDVDTTHGFMDQTINIRENGIRDGFPVIGADKIVPTLKKIKDDFMGFLPKLETVDAHTFNDPELKLFKSISDIHSEKGTKGFEKIEETIFGKPDVLIEVEPEKNDVPNPVKIKELLDKNGIIRLEKNENSPILYGDGKIQKVVDSKKGLQFFENLKKAGAQIALLYGVATDFCVKDAAAACKKFGIKPIVIEDAVKEAINNSLEDNTNEVFKDVAKVTSDELLNIIK